MLESSPCQPRPRHYRECKVSRPRQEQEAKKTRAVFLNPPPPNKMTKMIFFPFIFAMGKWSFKWVSWTSCISGLLEKALSVQHWAESALTCHFLNPVISTSSGISRSFEMLETARDCSWQRNGILRLKSGFFKLKTKKLLWTVDYITKLKCNAGRA